MAPTCGRLCTDNRMGLPVFRQLILHSPVRPPAFTLKATSPSLCCLVPFGNVYHVFFERSRENRVEPCLCSFIRSKPSSASYDPIDLEAPQSIKAFPVSSDSLADMLVFVSFENSPYAVWAVVSPFFSTGFHCFSGHCDAQCGPLQMTHFRSGLLLLRSRCNCC